MNKTDSTYAALTQEPVGIAASMPGTSGFTLAVFKAAVVPIGTSLYATPQPAASVASGGDAFTKAQREEIEAAIRSLRYNAHPHRSPHADWLEKMLPDAATAQLQPRTPAEPKCQNCDGKGGFITAEWVDPVSGPETEGERCEECNGSGLAAQPRTLDAPVSEQPMRERRAVLAELMDFFWVAAKAASQPNVDVGLNAVNAFKAALCAALPSPGATTLLRREPDNQSKRKAKS